VAVAVVKTRAALVVLVEVEMEHQNLLPLARGQQILAVVVVAVQTPKSLALAALA